MGCKGNVYYSSNPYNSSYVETSSIIGKRGDRVVTRDGEFELGDVAVSSPLDSSWVLMDKGKLLSLIDDITNDKFPTRVKYKEYVRRNPVIRAIKYDGDSGMVFRFVNDEATFMRGELIFIFTTGGYVVAKPGDYIISGEFRMCYPVSAGDFKRIYKEVI